jgi:hypothetical protein
MRRLEGHTHARSLMHAYACLHQTPPSVLHAHRHSSVSHIYASAYSYTDYTFALERTALYIRRVCPREFGLRCIAQPRGEEVGIDACREE